MEADRFPYDSVLAELRSAGKHFAPAELLERLARVRAQRPDDVVLERFLFTALDKHDGRYDNPSYLAIDLLDLPKPGDDPEDAAARRDRLVVALMEHFIAFEPAPKRIHHATRVLEPARARSGEPTAHERRLAELSLIPVSTVHDEVLFIRVLQAYEATFALIAVLLHAAIGAEEDDAAADLIERATAAMREAKPLFSLIGTLDPAAFLEFRQYTDGASAIQSRNYKLIESLCRRPDDDRLDSPAYLSVPEVRRRVLSGPATLSDAEPPAAVRAAMEGFEAVMLQWRQTHYRIAMRMLGDRRGTGYTAGVPYLEAGRRAPVFA